LSLIASQSNQSHQFWHFVPKLIAINWNYSKHHPFSLQQSTTKMSSKLLPPYVAYKKPTVIDRLEKARLEGIEKRISDFKCTIPQEAEKIIIELENYTRYNGKTKMYMPESVSLYGKMFKLLEYKDMTETSIIELLTPYFVGIKMYFKKDTFIFDWSKPTEN